MAHSVSKKTRAAEGTNEGQLKGPLVEQSMHLAMYLEENSTETKVRPPKKKADDSRFVSLMDWQLTHTWQDVDS